MTIQTHVHVVLDGSGSGSAVGSDVVAGQYGGGGSRGNVGKASAMSAICPPKKAAWRATILACWRRLLSSAPPVSQRRRERDRRPVKSVEIVVCKNNSLLTSNDGRAGAKQSG